MKVGPVQYARNGSVRLAYRVLGGGDTPLVYVPGWVSNIDDSDDSSNLTAALAERVTAATSGSRG